MSALVTGATGFVGSHVARRLVERGDEVHILCREASNFWRLNDILPRVRRHVVDLRDAALLAEIVRAVQPREVFHLASATVVAGAAAGHADLVTVNLLGTINLIEACATVDCHLVNTGDSFEYAPSAQPLREDAPGAPESLHGITKLAATQYATSVAHARSQPIVTLRLFSTYGPGDHPKRLVPRVVAGALAGTPLSLSRPEIARDWIHIDDLVALYLAAAGEAARLSGAVLNAGTGRKADLGQIVAMIRALASSQSETRWGVFPAPAHDATPWVADMTRTFAALPWRPRVALEEGLARTIAAAKADAP